MNRYDEPPTFDALMKELVEAGMDRDALRVQRQGSKVVVTDSVWAIVGPEKDLWTVLRHSPRRLPDGDGSWLFSLDGEFDYGDYLPGAPLLPTLEVADRLTETAIMTKLIVEHDEGGWSGLVRALWVTNRYLFVNDALASLFTWSSSLWFTEFKDGVGPVWGMQGNVRVMLLPVMPGTIDDRHLKPMMEESSPGLSTTSH